MRQASERSCKRAQGNCACMPHLCWLSFHGCAHNVIRVAVLSQLPATVFLPKKWQQATEPTRLEKRRCQLNHYFAELSGWANREGLDLWDPSVSSAFTDFISGPDDDGTEARSSARASGTQAIPLDPHGGAQHARSGSDVATSTVAAADSWEDSYLTIRSERTRETLVPQPPTRLGSFAFGVSQSKPSDSSSSNGSAVAGAASPAVAEVATGSPREGSGNNPLTESSTPEALRESERELGALCFAVLFDLRHTCVWTTPNNAPRVSVAVTTVWILCYNSVARAVPHCTVSPVRWFPDWP